MLSDLFGSRANLEATALAWAKDQPGEQVRSVPEAWPDWRVVECIRHPAESLWIRLTSILGTQQRLPFTLSRSICIPLSRPNPIGEFDSAKRSGRLAQL